MSSHHFVKDGQEPALVILDWDNKLEIYAKQLMAWQPKVIVSHKVVDSFLSSGYKPDAILGKLDDGYSFLEPLEFYKEEDLKVQFPECVFVLNKPVNRLNDFVRTHKNTVYSHDYKVYFYPEGWLKKWMPEGKTVYIYRDGLVPVHTNTAGVFELNSKGEVIFEET